MVNPEQTFEPDVQLSRRELLREFMHDDTGSTLLIGAAAEAAQSKWVRRVAAGALAVGVTFGFGIYKGVAAGISAEHDVNVTAEPAQYQGAFMYDMPRICWGGYQDTYNTSAGYDYKVDAFGITIDTHYSFSVNKQSQVTEVICTNAGSVKGTRDANGVTTVNLGKNDFMSYVFPTDPLTDKVETGNGITSAPQVILETVGKGLQSLNLPLIDKLNTSGSDDTKSLLTGLATLEGYRQSTEACSKYAQQDLGGKDGPLATGIASNVAEQQGIPADQVVVNLPATINLKDQYQPQYSQLDESVKSDDKLHLTLQNELKCEPSPDHGQVVTLPAGVAQPTAAGSQ